MRLTEYKTYLACTRHNTKSVQTIRTRLDPMAVDHMIITSIATAARDRTEPSKSVHSPPLQASGLIGHLQHRPAKWNGDDEYDVLQHLFLSSGPSQVRCTCCGSQLPRAVT